MPRMKLPLNTINIVDIEATCWDSAHNHPGQHTEIIEIGICQLDLKTYNIEKPGGELLIKPIHSKVSPFCTELTTLTQAQVDTGTEFTCACKYLIDVWDSKNIPWASWGNYDRKMFEKQCRERVTKYPFNDTHINLKTLFALMYGLDFEVGLDKAYEILNWKMEGTHHRGNDDANNIAKIACVIFNQLKKV